jgi:hypothetical protein
LVLKGFLDSLGNSCAIRLDTLAVKLGCDGRFLLLLLLTRHNPKTMPPSDRIHKRFGLTSTDCPAADGSEFYLWAELTLAVKLLSCLTRHHYIFKGDICSEVQRIGRSAPVILYALYRFLYSSEIPRKWKRYRVSFTLVAIHLPLSKGGSNGSPLATLR